MKAPAKLVLPLFAPKVSVAEAPELVIRPPVVAVSPASEPKTAVLALRSNTAPGATTRAEPLSVCAAPRLSTPPLTVVLPLQAFAALERRRLPGPLLVRPAVPV